jgi:hypothetical protein
MEKSSDNLSESMDTIDDNFLDGVTAELKKILAERESKK